jgi:hypothetical protein
MVPTRPRQWTNSEPGESSQHTHLYFKIRFNIFPRVQSASALSKASVSFVSPK